MAVHLIEKVFNQLGLTLNKRGGRERKQEACTANRQRTQKNTAHSSSKPGSLCMPHAVGSCFTRENSLSTERVNKNELY